MRPDNSDFLVKRKEGIKELGLKIDKPALAPYFAPQKSLRTRIAMLPADNPFVRTLNF